MKHDRAPGSNYRQPHYVSFAVIPALGGTMGVVAVAIVGVLDRFAFFRRLPSTIPFTDLLFYAVVAFAVGFVALVIKAVIWPWEQ